MSPPKKTVLEPLRVRLRRFQFTAGLGFLALVLGSVLSVALWSRLGLRVQALPLEPLRLLVGLVLQKLWVLAVLPVLAYGAARVIELRPWSTALGAMATGQGFLLALEFVQNGVEGWLERGWVRGVMEAVALALGVWLTQRAVHQGREAVARQTQRAQQQAAERKDEYAEFLREAERQGERIAQREAAQAPPQPTPGAEPSRADDEAPSSEPAPAQAPKTPST